MVELSLDMEQNTQSFSFYAFNILKTKAQKLFKKNSALFCLTKSDSFLKELLNIFNKLHFYDISADKFLGIVQSGNFYKVDRERLIICAKLYNEYVETMMANNYSIPVYKENCCKKFLNEDVVQYALKKIIAYECFEFDDVQSECLYIVNEIKKLVKNGLRYNEIAVFADKSHMRQKILDILKAESIPVIASIYHQEYENLKYKINLFYRISDVLKSLGLQEFSLVAIKNASILSRSEREIKFSELDELVKTFLDEILTDNYGLDKILFKKENSTKTLLEILFTNLDAFSSSDIESINKEFGLFKKFYELYFSNNYQDAIKLLINSKISKFEEPELKATIIRKLKSLEQLQNLYDNVLQSVPEFSSFMDIMEWLGLDKTSKNAIALESVSSEIINKKEFKYIFIAGLTENNFPGTNMSYPFISEQTNVELAGLLKDVNSSFDCFIKTDKIFYSQKLGQIVDVIKSAKEKLIFTTHAYESKNLVQSSVVFQLACENTNVYKRIKNNEQDIVSSAYNAEPFSSEKSKIISNDDILKLSPSAISTFQACPQKYYYKHLLNLKEPYMFSASYGSVVHAVFEVLYRRFLSTNRFNKEVALELGNILFDAKNNAEMALKAGFNQIDIDLINETADLFLAEMKDNFEDAVDDFNLSGGFDNPPKSAICEKSFSFSIEEIPNVVFDGRIDAIIENNDGQCSVVDYKTGHDKINTLEYSISEYGVNFLSRTGKEPSNVEVLQNAYDYQIPIYYLATQYCEEFSEIKDKISELGLVYIRPKSKDNGCREDLISAEKMQLYKDKIIQNLKETVINKIVNATEFKKQKSFFCENCAYKFLCDLEDEND